MTIIKNTDNPAEHQGYKNYIKRTNTSSNLSSNTVKNLTESEIQYNVRKNILLYRRPSWRNFDLELNQFRCSICYDKKISCDKCSFDTENLVWNKHKKFD